MAANLPSPTFSVFLEEPQPTASRSSSRMTAPLRTPLDRKPSLTSSSLSRSQKHESFDLSGSVFLITTNGQTLSLPIPSDSPADPLNWSRRKTGLAMFAVGLYSYAALIPAQAASLLYSGLRKDFSYMDSSPFTVETLVTAPTLFMGLGTLVWVPLSLALGRRPVFMLANLTLLFSLIGAGFSETFYQVLICVCCLGIAEGFALSAAFLMVIDMTYIDQRPKAIAKVWSVVGFVGVCSLSVVPYMTDHGLRWRNFYDLWAIVALISCLVTFFLYPETYYKRPAVAYNGLIILQSATEKLTIYEETEESSTMRELPNAPSNSHFRRFLDWCCLRRSQFGSWKGMGRCYLQIAFCVINPLIFWVTLSSAVNFAGMLFIGATYSRVLTAPPYELPSSLLIVVNISSGVGSLLALPLGGCVICFALKRLSRRNRGVREAEHYLVGYIIPVLTGSLSTLLYGLAVHYEWHYSVYYIAYGFNGLSWITISIFNTLWVTEAFPRWAAPALVVVGGGCYIMSFASSFALMPWIEAHGYKWVGVELTALQIGIGFIALPLAFWGKSARQRIHGRWANGREGALRPL
ncbi:MFS general substrate transporter [Corynespora cassiicola Philippines]|uniref:MFS general substrate transporter n=1 Tax=Corynespora cassiicola Philippines TaxID=1448308 RepID=A0A2T2P9Q8_CORCC|nr:MFS general substrate transporter [Corynespora cassiicola Philippines]